MQKCLLLCRYYISVFSQDKLSVVQLVHSLFYTVGDNMQCINNGLKIFI